MTCNLSDQELNYIVNLTTGNTDAQNVNEKNKAQMVSQKNNNKN